MDNRLSKTELRTCKRLILLKQVAPSMDKTLRHQFGDKAEEYKPLYRRNLDNTMYVSIKGEFFSAEQVDVNFYVLEA